MKTFDKLILELADARPDDFAGLISREVCTVQHAWRNGLPTPKFEPVPAYSNLMHAYGRCGDAEWLRTVADSLKVKRSFSEIVGVVESSMGCVPPPDKLSQLVVVLVAKNGDCEYALQAQPGTELWRKIISDRSTTVVVNELKRLYGATDDSIDELLDTLAAHKVVEVTIDVSTREVHETMRRRSYNEH